jgi:hypothetical protein
MFKVVYKGLRKKPTYDDLLQYIQEKQPMLKFPDRNATFILSSPQMAQFYSDTHFETEDLQNNDGS